jgi:hypothetical protein
MATTRVIQKVKTTSTHVLLADFPWGFFYSPCLLDLSPSTFHLFTYLKQFLASTRMSTNEEIKKTVKVLFNGLVADFYDTGMLKNNLRSVVMI